MVGKGLKFSLLVLLLASTGYALPGAAQTEDALLASTRKAGTIKAAWGSAPPFTVVSPDGKGTGYSPEVLKLALKGMGVPTMTAVLTSWDAQIPALQAHHVDMVGAGLQYTEDRCKVLVYSGPVTVQRNGLYVLSGNPKHLTGSLSQIANSPDVKLAATAGSAQEAYALQAGVTPGQILRVPDVQAGVATVKGGRADAFYAGALAITHLEQKGIEVVVNHDGPLAGYGAAFRKEDIRFRDELDKQLDVLRSNGTMKQMLLEAYEKNGIAKKDALASWDRVANTHRAKDVVPSCE
ncbi:transporter substrate-binding domain-containing protein [Bradyrhizobium sp. 190]|uniref:transporter substrate-binding domain-containing protein n=1 Tax=Bradyrhizobium sp. 190 TaxID=2782658 RepID=UPI001FF7B67D|nr:transporter substrate-binding domain-containing protein [Bradyrhizobium sp. 190]MCK1516957.1 transporter substrate-binding domain-containing protein [Bradyrhizobium sp. 190]